MDPLSSMIINVMAVPGNGQFNPEGAPTGKDAVPTMTISQDEGFMLRDMIAAGQKIEISLKLDIERRQNLQSQNVIATLPGRTDEQVLAAQSLASQTDPLEPPVLRPVAKIS